MTLSRKATQEFLKSRKTARNLFHRCIEVKNKTVLTILDK